MTTGVGRRAVVRRGGAGGPRPVCESTLVIEEPGPPGDNGRRQSVRLCADRQTRHVLAHVTRASSVSLHVERLHQAETSRAADPLFDVRKYTHLLHIAGITCAPYFNS